MRAPFAVVHHSESRFYGSTYSIFLSLVSFIFVHTKPTNYFNVFSQQLNRDANKLIEQSVIMCEKRNIFLSFFDKMKQIFSYFFLLCVRFKSFYHCLTLELNALSSNGVVLFSLYVWFFSFNNKHIFNLCLAI